MRPTKPAKSIGEPATATVGAPDDAEAGHVIGAEPAVLERGRAVGRYIVVDRVGSGGMGVVYKAFDPELDRVVAIKVLRLGWERLVEARERLQREAQALARLSHPNVIAVHDVGVTEGQVFLAMELVDGCNLATWVDENPPAVAEVLDTYRQAGLGLAAAHQAGLVHRDFKPGNVILGKDGRVRVLDFGLARPLLAGDDGAASQPFSSPSSLTETLTRTGTLLGTPAYMAPEQASGHPADARSDQYSFCVSLYQALYRELPRKPVPRFPRESRVPAAVRRALERGLALDPDLRFASMTELLAALDRRRERRRLRALAVALPVLLAVGSYAAWPAAPEPCGGFEEQLSGAWDSRLREKARAAFAAVGRSFGDATWDRTARVLDDYAGRWVGARTRSCEDTHRRKQQSVQRMEVEMRCLDRRRGELGHLVQLFGNADDVVMGRALEAAHALAPPEACLDWEGDGVVPPPATPGASEKIVRLQDAIGAAGQQVEAGHYADARAALEPLEKEARALGWPPLIAEVRSAQGRALSALDRYNDARAAFGEAVLLAEESGLDALRFKADRELLEVVGARLQRRHDAEQIEATTLALARRLGQDDLREADLALTRARVAAALGRHQQSAELAKRALALREQRLPEDHPDRARALLAVGVALDMSRLGEQAMPYIERALATAERAFGSAHPELAPFINERGVALNYIDRWSESEAEHRRAVALTEAAYGPAHSQVARSLYLLANILRRMRRYDEALAAYERAGPIVESTLGKDHPFWGRLRSATSSLMSSVHRFDEAERIGQEGLAALIAALGELHGDVAWAYIALAMTSQEAQRYEEAASRYNRAITILEEVNGADSPELIYPMHRMAISLDYIDHRRALPVFERVLQLTTMSQTQSPRDHTWAMWHTGSTLIETESDVERGIALVQEARASFVANNWDPDQLPEIDEVLAKGRRLLAREKGAQQR